MKPIMLRLVLGLLVSFGCGTIPGQDVRYEPTPMPVVRALLELADVGPQDLVYDLGSGDGRIPITAAKEFGARGVGIEIDPALVTQAQAKAREAGVEDKVEFRLGDMYAADVRSGYRRDSLPAPGTEPEATGEAALRPAGGFAGRFLRLGHGWLDAGGRSPRQRASDFPVADPVPCGPLDLPVPSATSISNRPIHSCNRL